MSQFSRGYHDQDDDLHCEKLLFDEERLHVDRKDYYQKSSKRRWIPRCSKAAKWLFLVDLLVLGLLVLILWPLITLLCMNQKLFPAEPLLALNATMGPAPLEQVKIPRILHQTTPNATIPEKWIQTQQSCKEVYSDYEYKLWTDDSAREFISTAYPWFLNVWDNYYFPIQRADAIRYFILHHYGGIYLDMDTFCNKSLPLDELEAQMPADKAIFQATRPTGVTNDIMIATAKHPAFARVISKMPVFYRVTRFWAWLQPYANIMMSTGPLFLSLALTGYLREQPYLPSPTIRAAFAIDLEDYITDLQSCTWRKADAHVMVWMGKRPWTWFGLGFIGFVIGATLMNSALLGAQRLLSRRRLLRVVSRITKANIE